MIKCEYCQQMNDNGLECRRCGAPLPLQVDRKTAHCEKWVVVDTMTTASTGVLDEAFAKYDKNVWKGTPINSDTVKEYSDYMSNIIQFGDIPTDFPTYLITLSDN